MDVNKNIAGVSGDIFCIEVLFHSHFFYSAVRRIFLCFANGFIASYPYVIGFVAGQTGNGSAHIGSSGYVNGLFGIKVLGRGILNLVTGYAGNFGPF